MSLTMLWFATAFGSPVNCDAATSVDALQAELGRAEEAIERLDPDELEEGVREAMALVPCLEVSLGPAEIARLYRLSGISRFVQDDWVEAVADFGVARAIDPGAGLPAHLGPPLRSTWDAVPPASASTAPLPPPADGWLAIDGRRGERAPTGRAYLLQWMRDDGSVHGTWMVEKGASAGYLVRVDDGRKRRPERERERTVVRSGEVGPSTRSVGRSMNGEVIEP